MCKPKPLRSPYQSAISAAEFYSLHKEIKDYLKPYAKKLQCAGVDYKSIRYGARLNIFLLGYRPGYVGDISGITIEEWNLITLHITELLQTTFKGQINKHEIIKGDWSANSKFSFDFQRYVYFTESAV